VCVETPSQSACVRTDNPRSSDRGLWTYHTSRPVCFFASHDKMHCECKALWRQEEPRRSGLSSRQQSAWRCHACRCGFNDPTATTAEYNLPAGLWGTEPSTEPRVGSLSYDPSEAPTTRTRINARATEEATHFHTCAPLALPTHAAGAVSMSDSVVHTADALERRDTIWGSHNAGATGKG
jgi:hypothetical protein